MALQDVWTNLDVELTKFSNQFEDFAAAKSALVSSSEFSLYDECLLEGLLSRTWQCWCTFCRSCLIESCLGTVTASGTMIPGITGVTTEAQVSGAARAARAKHGKPPYWSSTPNSVFRHEPTWGDSDVLNDLLAGLNPVNAPQLLAAFSTAHTSLKALQKIRNGAAHLNSQTFAEVQALGSAYLTFPVAHPTHALYWVEPVTNDYLILDILQQISDAGFVAVG